MVDEDPIEEFRGISMQTLAGLSRAAEVLIRAAQDRRTRQTAETARVTEDLQRRAEAHAQAAEQFYSKLDNEWMRQASAEDVATAWKGVHQWVEVDPDRFGHHAQAINTSLREVFNHDVLEFPRQADPKVEREAAALRVFGAVKADRGFEVREETTERQQDRGLADREDARGDQGADRGDTARAGAADHDDVAADSQAKYDSAERRQAEAEARLAAGAPKAGVDAQVSADRLNSQPATEATRSRKAPAKAKKHTQHPLARDRTRGR